MALAAHCTLAGTTAQAKHTSDRYRVTASSWTVRVALLVDALIDRVHQEWSTESAVLHLPTGDSLFIPCHRSQDPICRPGHPGYYQYRVRPSCEVNPIPHRRGFSGLRPLIMDVQARLVAEDAAPVVRYHLDLRTGDLCIEQMTTAGT